MTAAALYAVPYSVLGALVGSPGWVAAFAFDALVLFLVAVRMWSPLVVLAAALLSLLGYGIAWAIAGDGGHGSATLEIAGALAVALPIGTYGVRRGAAALAAIPLGWAAAGIWIALVARFS